MIYVEGLRKCTSLKVFRHLFIIPRSTIGLISISDDTNLQNFIEIHWKIASNFILFSNAEIILWFVRIYILPSFHLIMIEMPELDMPHYEPNNNTGIEK